MKSEMRTYARFEVLTEMLKKTEVWRYCCEVPQDLNLASCVGMNTLHHTCPHKTVFLAVCQKLCSINNHWKTTKNVAISNMGWY